MKSRQYLLAIASVTIFFCGQIGAMGQLKKEKQKIRKEVQKLLNEAKKAKNIKETEDINKKIATYLNKEYNKKRPFKIEDEFFNLENKKISLVLKKRIEKQETALTRELIKDLPKLFKAKLKGIRHDDFILSKERQYVDLFHTNEQQAEFWEKIYLEASKTIQKTLKVISDLKKWKDKTDENDKSIYITEQLLKLQELKLNFDSYNFEDEIDEIKGLTREQVNDTMSEMINKYTNLLDKAIPEVMAFAEEEKNRIENNATIQTAIAGGDFNELAPLDEVRKAIIEIKTDEANTAEEKIKNIIDTLGAKYGPQQRQTQPQKQDVPEEEEEEEEEEEDIDLGNIPKNPEVNVPTEEDFGALEL